MIKGFSEEQNAAILREACQFKKLTTLDLNPIALAYLASPADCKQLRFIQYGNRYRLVKYRGLICRTYEIN